MSFWLPKQYGAWAMLVAPVVTGAIIGGFGWGSVAVGCAWVVAYLAYMAVRGAMTGRRPRGFVTPSITYSILTACLVAGLLSWRPALLWWAIPLAVILGISLVLIATGHEHSAVNDAGLIGASTLMCAVTATAHLLSRGLTWHAFWPAVAWPTAWIATVVLAAYFWGTIPYVKTMIRERDKPGWYAGSVGYHVALIVPAFLVNRWVGGLALLVAARAVLVPKLFPRAKPKQIGVAEVVLTVLLVLLLTLTVH